MKQVHYVVVATFGEDDRLEGFDLDSGDILVGSPDGHVWDDDEVSWGEVEPMNAPEAALILDEALANLNVRVVK